MKILFALTYYRPYVSGPIIYVENLGRALVARGHEVTLLTSHYDVGLPHEEWLDGMRVVRVPVLFRLSKGVIMPSFPWRAAEQIRTVRASGRRRSCAPRRSQSARVLMS